jgi:hypothetical protein
MTAFSLLPSRLAAAGIVFAGLVLFSVPAFGQDRGPVRAAPAFEAPTLTEHLHAELESRSAERRQLALTDLVALGTCASGCQVALRSLPGRSGAERTVALRVPVGLRAVDLSRLAPTVLDTYNRSASEPTQVLALAALRAIGDESTMTELGSASHRGRSERVQRIAGQSVIEYFVAAYPELGPEVDRRGRLSMLDVTLAQQRRAAARSRG